MSDATYMRASRANLDRAVTEGPAHWRPIMTAVRDAGVSLCMVPQGKLRFDPPRDRPAIVVIGDDMLTSEGPAAFHGPSLKRFVRRCRGAVIVACEPIPVAYACAATLAAAGFNSIIVETRPEHEADWKAALDAANPSLHYVLATVQPLGGVQ